jgi:hypothetical protein
MQPLERAPLIDAPRILWIGRVAAFRKETWPLDRDAAEKRIIEEASIQKFKTLLYQLIL